jgi:hypothetical protein
MLLNTLVSPKVKNNKITIFNLLGMDGNFQTDSNSDGLGDGWTQSGNPTKTIANNIQNLTPLQQYHGMTYRNIPASAQDKIYICGSFKTAMTNFALTVSSEVGNVAAGSFPFANTPSFTFLSGIFTNPNGLFWIYAYTGATSGFSTTSFKNIFVINMTKDLVKLVTLPTKTKMDSVLQAKIAAEGYKPSYTFKLSDFK